MDIRTIKTLLETSYKSRMKHKKIMPWLKNKPEHKLATYLQFILCYPLFNRTSGANMQVVVVLGNFSCIYSL